MSTPHIAPPRSAKLSRFNLLPIQVYLQLFLSNPPHITSVFTKRTLNPCLLKIYFHSINCSWRFASPSATTARPAAYNSFLEYDFYTNLSAYQFNHSDKQKLGQGAPLCHSNIYFGLSLHPRSTQLPALRVPSTNRTSPWDPHPHSVPIVISLEIVA